MKELWRMRTDFSDQSYLQRKSKPKKFDKHHRDNCCLLWIIRKCSIRPYGVGPMEQNWKKLNMKKQYKTLF